MQEWNEARQLLRRHFNLEIVAVLTGGGRICRLRVPRSWSRKQSVCA